MTIYYVDLTGGNNSNDGLSFANRKLTIPSMVSGDEARVMGSAEPVLVDTDITWSNANNFINMSPQGPCKLIESCDSGWSGVTNVTVDHPTNSAINAGKSGNNCLRLVVAGAFTTGKAAFENFATLDLSAYEQICFWVRSGTSTGTNIAANALRIDLCSDTSGNTPVDSFLLPAFTAARTIPVVLNKGSALGSAIQSIAVRVMTDLGGSNVTLTFDNFCAALPASSDQCVTLRTLIGPTADGFIWYAPRCFDNTNIFFDALPGSILSSNDGTYPHPSETLDLYKRVPLELSSAITCSVSGATYSFGWDRTDMTTQNLSLVISAAFNVSSGVSYIFSGSNQTLTIGAGKFLGIIAGASGGFSCSSPGEGNNYNVPMVAGGSQIGFRWGIGGASGTEGADNIYGDWYAINCRDAFEFNLGVGYNIFGNLYAYGGIPNGEDHFTARYGNYRINSFTSTYNLSGTAIKRRAIQSKSC